MTRYLLDSDSLFFLIRHNPGLEAKIQQHGTTAVFLSIITVAEAFHGVYNSNRVAQNLKETQDIIKRFAVINLSEDIANKFGEIKATLRKNGQSMQEFDLLIGATAIVEGCILVTNNLKHFNRLGAFGLNLENWKS